MKIANLFLVSIGVVAPDALAAPPLAGVEGDATPLQSGGVPGVTVAFTLSDAQCALRSMSLTAKIANHSAAAFTGTLTSPQDPSSGGPISVSAGGEGTFGAKTSFNCEHAGHLTQLSATVKAANGQLVGSKAYRLTGYDYAALAGRPPSAGQTNVIGITSVKAEQMVCGQPIWIKIDGYSSATEPHSPVFSAALEYAGAAASNTELKAQPKLQPNAAFSVRLVGGNLDCSAAAPVVKPAVKVGAALATSGALEGAPAMHAAALRWAEGAAP